MTAFVVVSFPTFAILPGAGVRPGIAKPDMAPTVRGTCLFLVFEGSGKSDPQTATVPQRAERRTAVGYFFFFGVGWRVLLSYSCVSLSASRPLNALCAESAFGYCLETNLYRGTK